LQFGETASLLCPAPRGALVSVLVDTADLPILMGRGLWRVYNFHSRGHNQLYVVRSENHKTQYMHRVLMNPGPDQVPDHMNGRGTDNRRSNLRLVSKSQNQLNRHRFGLSSPYGRGVSFDPRPNKIKRFAARVGDIRLGYHLTKEQAQGAVREYIETQI
jgi:hypothetical protein